MIKIWKQNNDSITQSAILERDCWLQVTDPSQLEIESLEREYGIEPDVVHDILDADERSRTEREERYNLIIYRVPAQSMGKSVPYVTVPLGIILVKNLVITICSRELELINSITDGKKNRIDLSNQKIVVLRLFQQTAAIYHRYLKEINRRTTGIEQDLQRSIKNIELIGLLDIEKSLVYFTTSLRSDELVVDKLTKMFLRDLKETELDLLEDVVTENKQAIEMANIYSNILSGMMDAFASVISNNLNTVLKRLTMISIVLMIPTLLASLYGMNLVHLPFSKSPLSFVGIIGVSFVIAVLATLVFARMSSFTRVGRQKKTGRKQ